MTTAHGRDPRQLTAQPWHASTLNIVLFLLFRGDEELSVKSDGSDSSAPPSPSQQSLGELSFVSRARMKGLDLSLTTRIHHGALRPGISFLQVNCVLWFVPDVPFLQGGESESKPICFTTEQGSGNSYRLSQLLFPEG